MNAPAAATGVLMAVPVPAAANLPGVLRRWFIARMAAGHPDADASLPGAGAAVGDGVGPSDREDIQASLLGDGEAYARLVRRYQQPIAQTMWRFTRDRNQWEELVQEVFVEAYASLRTYQAKAPLLNWLRRIATRVGYRFWKDRSRRQTIGSVPIQDWDVLDDGAESERNAKEDAEVLHATLARLAARDRLVLTLMYLEECSVAEIAERTGWSRTMVKVQAHRARKRLKTLLEEASSQP